MNKEIGGFFELELNKFEEFHKNAFKLNTGRNCLKLILKKINCSKIYLPRYICRVIIEIIMKSKIEYEFYSIDRKLDPIIKKELCKNEYFLYANYFGIKDDTVRNLRKIFKQNLIIDNAQAFFSKPLYNTFSFYSPRKFFGVPDGGLFYPNIYNESGYKKDKSYKRIKHLVARIDGEIQEAFQDYKKNEILIEKEPIKTMSEFTCAILKNIDFKRIKKIREENFEFLHSKLKEYNELEVDFNELNGPMVYPFLCYNSKLRDYLIGNKIFVAKYWPDIEQFQQKESYEYEIINFLISIPIDQRYGIKEMDIMVNFIRRFLDKCKTNKESF